MTLALSVLVRFGQFFQPANQNNLGYIAPAPQKQGPVTKPSFWSILDSEGPDLAETCTPHTGANRLELASSSICNGIFLQRLEGPGTPGEWSYIGN